MSRYALQSFHILCRISNLALRCKRGSNKTTSTQYGYLQCFKIRFFIPLNISCCTLYTTGNAVANVTYFTSARDRVTSQAPPFFAFLKRPSKAGFRKRTIDTTVPENRTAKFFISATISGFCKPLLIAALPISKTYPRRCTASKKCQK